MIPKPSGPSCLCVHLRSGALARLWGADLDPSFTCTDRKCPEVRSCHPSPRIIMTLETWPGSGSGASWLQAGAALGGNSHRGPLGSGWRCAASWLPASPPAGISPHSFPTHTPSHHRPLSLVSGLLLRTLLTGSIAEGHALPAEDPRMDPHCPLAWVPLPLPAASHSPASFVKLD